MPRCNYTHGACLELVYIENMQFVDLLAKEQNGHLAVHLKQSSHKL